MNINSKKNIVFNVVNLPVQNSRVDCFLVENTDYSREFIKQQTILVNNITVKPSHKLKLQDVVEFIYIDEIPFTPLLTPENIPLNIIFEDEHLLVVNKSRGMVVHPARGNWTGTLANALAFHLDIKENPQLRLGIVHRLDKETTGLILIAKNKDSQNKLIPLFKERNILKVYQALVRGFLPTSYDMINLPIGRHPTNRIAFSVNHEKGKEAISEYQVLKEWKKTSLVKVRIHTGRTHQIRVHLSHLGNPIIGDKIYSSVYNQFPLCLCATKLSFIHPFTKRKMQFEVELPSDMIETINNFS